MKAFVYSKKTNKKLAQFDNVDKVEYVNEKTIRVNTTDDGAFIFDTKEVKTTVFIN